MAPEINNNRGLAYSPLKADFWSCGWVVMGFLRCVRVGEPHEELLTI